MTPAAGSAGAAHGPATGRRVRAQARLVLWLKFALPLAALALLATLFLSARERGDLEALFTPEELARLSAGLRLDNPRLAGMTAKGEPFAVRADWVLPDSAVPRHLEVARPSGEIALADGRRVTLASARAEVDRVEKHIRLAGDVVLESSDGFRLATETVEIDVAAERAVAPGPVRVDGPQGRIEAGSMRAVAGPSGLADGTIWFENGVRVVFIPAREDAAAR